MRQLLKRKDLPAVLLTGHEKSLIFQWLVLVGCERSQEARNFACLHNAPNKHCNRPENVQVEAMDLFAAIWRERWKIEGCRRGKLDII